MDPQWGTLLAALYSYFVGCHYGGGGGKLFKGEAVNSKMNGNTETVIRIFFAVRCGGVETPYLFTKAY